MNFNPIRLPRNPTAKLLDWILAPYLNRGNLCGTQNQANREAWLEQTLANIPAGSRILDAGAGELQYARFCTHMDYVSQDFALYDGHGDTHGLQTEKWDQTQLDIISDITCIPEPDGAFDVVMCVEVLEHLPAPVDALKEMSRLIKPNGFLILTAPFCSLTHFSPYFYHTGFSCNFFEYWLKALGFEIIEMQWNGNYFEYLAQELRRLPSVSIKYSNETINWIERKALGLVLVALNRLSKNDNGSEDLLYYGLHVLAKKAAN